MNKLICFLYISITTLPVVLSYLLDRKYRRKIKLITEDDNKFYNQLLSVTMKNFNCKPHVIEKNECSENCSLAYQKIIQTFISSAKSSICLCIYIFTLKSLTYELIKAHKRGVDVRVISDQIMFETKSQRKNFSILSKNEIPYKLHSPRSIKMHHKFCLIDKDDPERAKMFSGSLNLTNQGFCYNFDNTVLTNNIYVIKRFSDEFEKLWNLF
ncbi:mitochondrial cardiolipin hydrolase-like [Diorhabda sublineata]|uniref:mitochondrial cardiolipin hydrolase-like n=1 Tax=Diorhabda sublineata TaxID=1163346 RepID=UPI0024E076FA|nr:mitochondrial cardiolipin hydrolase-like [Diorhabda sublineata]